MGKGKAKAEGTGRGTAYKRGRTWDCKENKSGGHPVPAKRRKGGFATKTAAVAYCETLKSGGVENKKEASRLFE